MRMTLISIYTTVRNLRARCGAFVTFVTSVLPAEVTAESHGWWGLQLFVTLLPIIIKLIEVVVVNEKHYHTDI